MCHLDTAAKASISICEKLNIFDFSLKLLFTFTPKKKNSVQTFY